jgi:hypothetical protein
MQIAINTKEETLIKEALIDFQNKLVGQGVKYNTVSDILNKINNAGLVKSDRIPRILLNKQYMFTFEGGGWNTVWAKTRKGAIRAALAEYKDSDSLNVIVSSVHLATDSGLKSAMSLFY